MLVQVDSEMNILRGERDQAKDIIDDLQEKLQAVMAVLADYDAERQVRGAGAERVAGRGWSSLAAPVC